MLSPKSVGIQGRICICRERKSANIPTDLSCHATTRFLEGFLEAKKALVRVSAGTEVLRRVLEGGACHRKRLEGAWKAETRPVAECGPLCAYTATEEALLSFSFFFGV